MKVLVGNSTRLNTAQWKAHYKTGRLPAGSLLEVGNGRLLTSAEHFFLKTAPKLSVARAVLLGMELCGWYSTLMSRPYQEHCNQLIQAREISLDAKPWPPADWDMSLEHQRDLMRNGFVSRSPLTTPERIGEYLNRALSDRSHSRALVTSRLLQADSHSPMESRLYARYCLPKRYGGLYLRPVRLKRNILESTGIRIISIDRKQFANEDVLELYAQQIAKGLGIPKWKLKAKPAERLARFELLDDICSWDYDLYRPQEH